VTTGIVEFSRVVIHSSGRALECCIVIGFCKSNNDAGNNKSKKSTYLAVDENSMTLPGVWVIPGIVEFSRVVIHSSIRSWGNPIGRLFILLSLSISIVTIGTQSTNGNVI
jgi:hypothetical protein